MTTISITHPQLVAKLVKSPLLIIETLTPFSVDLWHGATGVAGEAGELLEAILYVKPEEVDRVNIREELGDLFFYMEQIVQRSGIAIDWDGADEIARHAIISPDQILPVGASLAIHASQVLDSIKKVALYNKPLDQELLTNQMGALAASAITLGYMFGLAHHECLAANIVKLSKRYASLSYSDQQAQDRADKVQPPEGIIPGRKYFSGDIPVLPAETKDVVQPHIPRTADMQDIADAEKRSQ